MSIEVKCEGCGKSYSVGEQFAGKKAKCTACGGVMFVPKALNAAIVPVSSSGAADVPPLPEAAVPAAPPLPSVGRPPIPAIPLIGSQKTRGFRIGFHLNRLTLSLIFLGSVLFYFGIKERRLAAAAKATPQQITCLQLEAKGPGDNAYVDVTGLFPTNNFVYEERKGGGDWSIVWIPVIPVDGAFMSALKLKGMLGQIRGGEDVPVPQKIKVIVKSNKIRNQQELATFAHRRAVHGMVINKVDSLSSKELGILRQSYPLTDFAECWIVEDGREPASMGKYAMFFGGGAALALLGLFLMFLPN